VTPADDICSPNGTSRLYEVSLANARSTILNASGTRVAYVFSTQQINKVGYYNVNGTRVLGTSDSTGTASVNKPAAPYPVKPMIINWREIVPTQ
jgi:hypothetical protein